MTHGKQGGQVGEEIIAKLGNVNVGGNIHLDTQSQNVNGVSQNKVSSYINQQLDDEQHKDSFNKSVVSQVSMGESVDRPNKLKISKSKVKEIRIKEGKYVSMNENFEKQSVFEDSKSSVGNKRYK